MGKFEIKRDKAGKFRFNLKAGNGQVILTSEGYNTKSACEIGIESVRKNSQDRTKFDRQVAKNGKPYFNLKATNGQVIGASQMYAGSASLENGIRSVQKNAPVARVELVGISSSQIHKNDIIGISEKDKADRTKEVRRTDESPGKGKIQSRRSMNRDDFEIQILDIFRENGILSYKGEGIRVIIPLLDFLEFNIYDTASLLKLDVSVVKKWKEEKQDFDSHSSKDLEKLFLIMDLGVQIFENPKNFKEWLNQENKALQNNIPIDLIKTSEGLDLVKDTLDALSWGNYI